MCGIAGFLGAESPRMGERLIKQMCDRIAHRGPDAWGWLVDGEVALGHRRLSIIDLEGGSQPLGNEDGSVQIVFNGEIYNYRLLRKELVERGHHFATHSDTEVLVHLYEDVGDRLPQYLNGMFAFAIWDSRRQQLFLARDRFGKKPLYYSLGLPGFRFCFASELKALQVLPGFSQGINARAAADFLALGYVPEPHSIYDQVSKLPPGHSIVVAPSNTALHRYWTPDFNGALRQDFDDTVEEIRMLATDAVERRMISDVPLGGLLSGGVDSTAVVGLMALKSARPVRTFSIGFSDPRLNELSFAAAAVNRYRTDHEEQVVTPSIEDVFDRLVWHFDEPFGDPSAVPMLYVSRMARRHVTVALSGDGADEVFGGYRRYYWNLCEERLRSLFPSVVRKTLFRIGARYYPRFEYMPRLFRARATLNLLSRELPGAYFTHMSAFRDDPAEELLGAGLRRELAGYSSRESFCRRFEPYRHLPPLMQMQAVDLETYLPGDILVKVDRASMAYALEIRSPWLDFRLAELAGLMPADWKLTHGIGKFAFKEAVRPYVPAEIIDRTKMGFAVPLGAWLRTSLVPVFDRLVFRPDMQDLLSLPLVRQMSNEHRSGRRNHGPKLWNILMFSAWHARFQRGEALDAKEVFRAPSVVNP